MANRLRTIMERRGITVVQLAKAVGVSSAAVCRWRDGQRRPSVDAAYRVAFALGCDVRDVFPPILDAQEKRAG